MSTRHVIFGGLFAATIAALLKKKPAGTSFSSTEFHFSRTRHTERPEPSVLLVVTETPADSKQEKSGTGKTREEILRDAKAATVAPVNAPVGSATQNVLRGVDGAIPSESADRFVSEYVAKQNDVRETHLVPIVIRGKEYKLPWYAWVISLLALVVAIAALLFALMFGVSFALTHQGGDSQKQQANIAPVLDQRTSAMITADSMQTALEKGVSMHIDAALSEPRVVGKFDVEEVASANRALDNSHVKAVNKGTTQYVVVDPASDRIYKIRELSGGRVFVDRVVVHGYGDSTGTTFYSFQRVK